MVDGSLHTITNQEDAPVDSHIGRSDGVIFSVEVLTLVCVKMTTKPTSTEVGDRTEPLEVSNEQMGEVYQAGAVSTRQQFQHLGC